MERAFALAGLVLLAACSRSAAPGAPEAAPEAPPGSRLSALPSPRFPVGVDLLERTGTGRVRYLGLDVEPASGLEPGAQVEVQHYFQAMAPMRGDYAVLVELYAPGVDKPLVSDAHRPIAGRVPTHTWKAGELWADKHKLRIPPSVRAPVLEVRVALVEGGQRMTVEATPGGQDGQDRVKAATVAIDVTRAPPPDDGLPTVVIPRATSSIAIDGRLDDAAWAKAPVLGFADTMGRDGALRFPTQLKLLWDDQNLYVAFDSVDHDVTCPFEKRDDPIYDHETVELFIMPHVIAPALGPYIELQASPKGVIFDASFTARRQGMDKSFDGAQTVATQVDGTLNDPAPDKGWRSEWKAPWKSLRWVTRPPIVGDEWRMNAFRIEKHRDGAQFAGEYGAWSPPRVGDFHAVDKFGRMRFGP